MSAFDELDAMALDASLAAFGDLCTIYPMKTGPDGRNGQFVPDADRDPLDNVLVVRSRWASHASISGRGEGIPNYRGDHKQGAAAQRHIATVKLVDLAWPPRQGDELAYADEPDKRFRISELMPDGLAGQHLGLTRV